MPRLLIVDDESSICWGLEQLGKRLGLDVRTASTAEQGIEAAHKWRPDLVLLDVRLPGMDGLTAIGRLRSEGVQSPVIIMTAYGDLETAVKAVRSGAFDYITKPFGLEQVERAISRALAANMTEAKSRESREYVGGLAGSSPAMQEVFKRIALAAAADACVLLYGESGTGKELAARAIHRYSGRADGPFVAVNVASLSESLAESELFGHVQGAFTDAKGTRTGFLAQAHGGTLFLDEVADIPLPVQVKLLRVLEHGEVIPVGSNQSVDADFRVISATHQDLLQLVEQGRFRHDLYFRLCAFQLDIPPLRDRRTDIPDLAIHLAQTVGDTDAVEFSAEALQELDRRDWPGNVRELRNAIEHALIVARGGVIMPEHFPPPRRTADVAAVGTDFDRDARLAAVVRQWAEDRLAKPEESDEVYAELIKLVERPLLEAAIARHGQCAAAARWLGVHRTTLRKKLDELKIDEP